MKGLCAFLLIGAAAAYLLGYSPSDLMYMWPSGGGSSVQPKARHTARSAEENQPPGQAAPVRSSGSSVVVSTSDGSLEQRWKP